MDHIIKSEESIPRLIWVKQEWIEYYLMIMVYGVRSERRLEKAFVKN